MDALANLEQIEYIINNAGKSFSGNTIKVDGEDMFQLVEQLRLSLTEELRQARTIIQEKNNILGEAQKEASSIMEEVEENISTMIDENKIMIKAQEEAAHLLLQAEEKAQKITERAKVYANQVLEDLDIHLRKTLENIASGREQLQGEDSGFESDFS